jgi:hypothetical protein
MELIDIVRLNLLSPMVLTFVLGIITIIIKSDLKIPDQVYSIISIYLLFAIGLKGGFDLARFPTANFGGAVVVAVLVGAAIPVWSFWLLRRFGKLDAPNAISIAIHYGSVSAITLSACVTFLNEIGESFEGYMPTMYVIMELPAVVVGLIIAGRVLGTQGQKVSAILQSALTGKGFLLLGGGIIIGFISGEPGYQQVKPFFVELFPGFLALFLLEMGQRVGSRLSYLRKIGLPLLLFSFIMPPLHGIITLILSSLAGLSVGGATVMATLAASASYITAPAVVEANIPDVDITPALTASLVLTFPFNLIIGLPVYYELAKLLI